MLLGINEEFAADPEILAKTAETLELAYRSEIENSGFPDFDNLQCNVTSSTQHSEGVLLLTESCIFPDGLSSQQRILVASTPSGWKVLNVLKEAA